MFVGCHVKCLSVCLLFLFDFNSHPNVLMDFWNNPKYEISIKSVRWEPLYFMRTDGGHDKDNGVFSQLFFESAQNAY